jgi:hypothetical protein
VIKHKKPLLSGLKLTPTRTTANILTDGDTISLQQTLCHPHSIARLSNHNIMHVCLYIHMLLVSTVKHSFVSIFTKLHEDCT